MSQSTKTLKLWRTFVEGMRNVSRNKWLSFATITILTLSLFIIGLSTLVVASTSEALDNLKNRVNLTVSFNPDVTEERIKSIQSELEKFKKEIASVEYVSRDQALNDFLAQSGDDPTIRKALDEIGENPLLASLVIKAVRAEDYEVIAREIEQSTFQSDINRVNYKKNKNVFDRLALLNQNAKRAGILLGILLVGVALVINFYTILITMYSHKEEFEIMRLVGASNLYMKMPFIFQSSLFGIIASVIANSMLAIVVQSASLREFLLWKTGEQINTFLVYKDLFLLNLAGLTFLGIFLGVVSSSIAIRRYFKI